MTDTVLMVRPTAFRYNEQTAANNLYQHNPSYLSSLTAQDKARNEFEGLVTNLRHGGIHVIVVEDNRETDTPDAVFPNNWISFHDNGTVVLYPMWAPNRRLERRQEILTALQENHGYWIKKIMDYSPYENEGKFLEGTGSLVLDRIHKIAYACLSPRTHPELVQKFCDDFGYQPVIFHAYQEWEGKLHEIYHTNVMMSVGENIAVICADTIKDVKEREKVLQKLSKTGKEIVLLTEEQNNHFAGNMLQLHTNTPLLSSLEGGNRGVGVLVMSEQAYRSLSYEQIRQIEEKTAILYSPLDTIETCGGGSARCMMAEVFLPMRL